MHGGSALSEGEVRDHLKNLKVHKYIGPDEIPSEKIGDAMWDSPRGNRRPQKGAQPPPSLLPAAHGRAINRSCGTAAGGCDASTPSLREALSLSHLFQG